jgi:hypothetical protein
VFPWTASTGAPGAAVELVRLAYTDLDNPSTSVRLRHSAPPPASADHSVGSVVAPARQLEPRQGAFGLFGWDKVPALADELVLAASELDAMAIWQSTGRAAVALPMGTAALPVRGKGREGAALPCPTLCVNLAWGALMQVTLLPMLERFKRLYLWFDDDVPGQEAVERMGRKLGKDRCFVVRSRARPGNVPASTKVVCGRTASVLWLSIH